MLSACVALSDDYTPDEVLSLAANGELHSQHPLALAVLKYAHDRQIVIPLHDECEILVGRGVRADWAGNRILVGTGQMLQQFGVSVPAAAEAQHASYTAAGESVMYVAHQDQLIGLIGVRDKVRPEAMSAVTQLSAMGVPHLVMLSGDIEETARVVARAVGLKDWRAQLSPEQKYELIRELRARGRRVAMVGDGINDAPALALADVGIAMGTVGSDVAIEAADIALASDNLHQVATTVRLSRQTLQVMRQNYSMALVCECRRHRLWGIWPAEPLPGCHPAQPEHTPGGPQLGSPHSDTIPSRPTRPPSRLMQPLRTLAHKFAMACCPL